MTNENFGGKSKSEENIRLTMGQNIDSFIVNADDAVDAVFWCHKRPVATSDVRIELKMLWHFIPTLEQDLVGICSLVLLLLLHSELSILINIDEFRCSLLV